MTNRVICLSQLRESHVFAVLPLELHVVHFGLPFYVASGVSLANFLCRHYSSSWREVKRF